MSAVDARRQVLRTLRPGLSAEDEARELEGTTRVLATMIDNQARSLTREWRRSHPGQDPEFSDLLAIQKRAQLTANELLSAQILEELAETDTEMPAELVPTPERSAVLRWTADREYVESHPDSEMLAEKVWPTATVRFQVQAASLIEAHMLDGLPVPNTAEEPLAQKIAAAVEERIAAADAAR